MTVWPEGFIDSPESAAVVINIGGAPVEARPGQAGFEVVSGANGLVAFSKICTHAGCAVSLFNVLVDAADLPLPPVDVQHPPGLQAGVRPGVEAAAAAAPGRGARRLT